jgi:hypothetical protein
VTGGVVYLDGLAAAMARHPAGSRLPRLYRWRVGLRIRGAAVLPVVVEAATVLDAIAAARETRRDAHGAHYAYRLAEDPA